MKKAIFISALSLIGVTAIAQCDKDVTYSANKAEFLNASDSVEKTEDTHVTVQISPGKIVLTHHDDESDQLTGVIKNFHCNWPKPFMQGETTFETEMSEPSGDVRDATVTVTGDQGKTIILIYFKEWKRTIRIEPTSHTETEIK